MKISILDNRVCHLYNPKDSYQVYDFRVKQEVVQVCNSKGILFITEHLDRYNSTFAHGIIAPNDNKPMYNTSKIERYMLVSEDDIPSVVEETMGDRWDGFVFDNLSTPLMEREYPRNLVRSLLNAQIPVFILGLQYPRQALWFAEYYNNKIAGIFTSLPVVYGSFGVVLHPEARINLDIPENQITGGGSGYYDNIIRWNVRCMDAWAQGITLPKPSFL
jgi:hypothetical protein